MPYSAASRARFSADDLAAGFPTPTRVSEAAGSLPGVEPHADPGHDLAALYGAERPAGGRVRRYRVELSAGVVRVASSVSEGERASESMVTRGAVTSWSRKSRLRMVETMAALDWSPVVDPGPGKRPAMVTLTLPGDWESLAPTGAEFKAMLDRFRKRWERKWGPVAWVWKLEFQRRGAPHVHIYTAVPVARGFRDWLSQTWYEAVGSGDERHLRAGTGVDWGEGIRASDPKRLAIYFLKRATGHNLGRDKEYQHIAPEIWVAAPCPRGIPCEQCQQDNPRSVGRFWGYRGLRKATAEVELSRDRWVQLRRCLRRWARANGRPVRSLSGGHGMGGMVLVNDAPGLVAQACRWSALGGGGGPPVQVKRQRHRAGEPPPPVEPYKPPDAGAYEQLLLPMALPANR